MRSRVDANFLIIQVMLALDFVLKLAILVLLRDANF